MIRVVYETRCERDCGAELVRRVEMVSECELNLAKSTLRGTPVTVLQHHRFNIALPKATPAIRTSTKKNYNALKVALYRHFRRSSWNQLVYLLVDDLIKDLEWEDVLANAGYPPKHFSYVWHRFKKQFVKELRYSPATRDMLPRLERQPWLLAYLEEDKN